MRSVFDALGLHWDVVAAAMALLGARFWRSPARIRRPRRATSWRPCRVQVAVVGPDGRFRLRPVASWRGEIQDSELGPLTLLALAPGGRESVLEAGRVEVAVREAAEAHARWVELITGLTVEPAVLLRGRRTVGCAAVSAGGMVVGCARRPAAGRLSTPGAAGLIAAQ